MRTTVNIDDVLLRGVKELAVQSDRTIGSVLEDALRAYLERERARRVSEFTPLPTFSPVEPGLRPGVDLEDRHAVMDLLDGIGPRD